MKGFIEDIIETVKLKSAIYFKYGFCKPWGMDVANGPYSQFHMITSGHCILVSEVGNLFLEKGDIVIFPTGAPHQIKDTAGTKCVDGAKAVQEIIAGKKPFNGNGAKTELICGHYELDRELSHLVFTQLPNQIIIKSSEYGRFDLMQSLFDILVEEMDKKRAGFETVSLKLAEVLFISIIRHYFLRKSGEKNNLFTDELVFSAIDQIHRDLSNKWSIRSLARKSGVSRTLFIDRFKNAVGVPPIRYISNWKLVKAKYLLKNTEMTMSQISSQLGYSSNASFNRAFKLKFEITPGKYRSLIAN
jgi:AraC-like DNA-binding protein